ncbi:MAG: asparagine synthase (glutamine-hydrolyzing) [Alphaproteobacteria bacterium]|nr:asparagine synthase (glutamine-hydrolyzing) [Alphaproteobacteria bacterium]
MCGIGGVFIKKGGPPHHGALNKMCMALHSRGPDGDGVYTDQSIGLVHTRLSIIDSEGGHQPMISPKGAVLVFNGEIYNYVEIRNTLKDLYPFQTKSDTETILALYDVYGLDFVNHLRGMYAIGLYDPTKNRLVIARDPFGIKPLYITDIPSHVAFASEPKALIQSGYASDTIDISALRSVVVQNYIPGVRSPYPAIQRLQPGEILVYEHGIKVSSSVRPSISHAPPRIEDEETALLHLEKTLIDCVDVHCRSDVGYGIFLSGGVDSSTITQVLSMIGKQRSPDRAIQSYTAYFDIAGSSDERSYAKAVADSTHAHLHEVPFGKQDFISLLPQIAAYMDDPVADYAILPTWKLAAVAAKEQKVVLCGEGGDELFAGYGRYRHRWWKEWRKRKKAFSDIKSPHWSRLQREQANDIGEYLPNDLLIKLDTCLMAHGLEGRTPFLDQSMSEFAFTLPDNLKLDGKTGKYLLKKWLDSKLPESKPFRKKQGFTVPVGHWMCEDARNLSDVMIHHPLITELLSRSDLDLIPKLMPTIEGAKQCWPLLYLALWYTGKQKNGHTPHIIETLDS